MNHKVLAFLREQALVSPGDRVICAVSGGADSMAMLWFFFQYREALGITLAAAHYNHGLRGAESDRDEAFVRDFCEKRAIPLYVGRGRIAPAGHGLEAAAREARYHFLTGLDLEAKIATAHTANDNAETLLLHLLHGTALPGLGGIPPKRGPLIRPMLTVTRQEILAYLRLWHLPHVEDSSNAQTQFTRNRLRRELLPRMEQENPQLIRQLSACALRLREDEAYLTGQAERARRMAALPDGRLSAAALAALPPAMQSRVLRLALRDWGLTEPDSRHLSLAAGLLAAGPSGEVHLPGLTLAREYDAIGPARPTGPFSPVSLPRPGSVRAGAFTISCRETILPENFVNTPFQFAIGCDTIVHHAFTLRPRQTGDQIHLSGGTKSLKKLFIDRKIPARLRAQYPVLTAGGKVLALIGAAADTRYLVSSGAAILFTVVQDPSGPE